MSDYSNLRLEKSIENTQRIVESSDKGLKVFKSALFEVVAAILLVALCFYENGTLTVKKQDLIVFLGNIAVMFILSMLFDNNYRIKGKLVGMSTEKYKTAYDELLSIKKTLSDDDIKRLDERIEEYLEEELSKKRKNMLYKGGITLAFYEKYQYFSEEEKKKSKISLKKRLLLKKAARISVYSDKEVSTTTYHKR